MLDPNPQAARGGETLAAAGIRFEHGLMEAEAKELNIGFVSRMTRGRPWVRMKIAATLDGRTALANGKSQWITGAEARKDGHRWRARACAILTGYGTIKADDPRLTVRDVETPRQPLRVIVDSRLETPATREDSPGRERAFVFRDQGKRPCRRGKHRSSEPAKQSRASGDAGRTRAPRRERAARRGGDRA